MPEHTNQEFEFITPLQAEIIVYLVKHKKERNIASTVYKILTPRKISGNPGQQFTYRTYSAVLDNLKQLKKFGIVSTYKVGREVRIQLTEKGMKVSNFAKKISELVKE